MQCRVCDSKKLEMVFDLGLQPWGNHFLKQEEVGQEPFYPLRLLYCLDCSTTQLDYTVKKEVMFSEHTYLSGVTRSLNDHFQEVAEYVDHNFFKHNASKSVLDIGSNDGTQLKKYKKLGYEVLGVESSKTISRIANINGIPTINEFFNGTLAASLGKKFNVINASGVFFHLDELHSVTEGIKEALENDGVFVVQFLYMKKILENLAFDQIYHEHLLYYNLGPIEVLLARHGLSMFDAYISPIHGGSVIGFITHKNRLEKTERLKELLEQEEKDGGNKIESYKQFAMDVQKLKADNRRYLETAKKMGKTIYGFGAPVKGNTLLNYFDIGTEILDCLVEKNELRKGLYSPGKHIPIVIEREVKNPPDIYYVLAWNFKKEILKNNQGLLESGVEFYFPINPKE
ncbi:MAG: class I SAM-dependent methyltransferase [Leptospirillum sp.]